jgi:N-acetyl-anhydromuramyl-L-alanine amidase AmpD
MREINKIIVHCAATPNFKDFSKKHIDEWHKARGFNKSRRFSSYCGYHFVIKTDGIIEKGRMLFEQGAHCKGYNTDSIGICMIGTDKYTKEHWESYKLLLRELKELFPNATIHGHREFSNKYCPGFDVNEIEI